MYENVLPTKNPSKIQILGGLLAVPRASISNDKDKSAKNLDHDGARTHKKNQFKINFGGRKDYGLIPLAQLTNPKPQKACERLCM